MRADLLEPEDAAGHVELAVLCLKHGLYPYARSELAMAEGVGYPDARRLGALREAVEQAEADEAFARIEQLKAEQEYEKALEEVRRFLVQAPQSPHTLKARQMVPDLLRRIDLKEQRLEEDRKLVEEDRKASVLALKIIKLQTQAQESRAKGDTSYAEAVRYHELGNVTRARKGYEAAEAAVLRAVQILTRVQRTAGRGVAFDKADQDKDSLRKRLVDVYLGLAKLYLDDRNYKRGVLYVNRVLYLDPVNREALDLRTGVDENRIRLSLRKLTNTPVRTR